MKRINAIDQKLTSLFADFGTIANEIELPFICELSDEATIANQTYAGIYRIDISTAGANTDVSSWVAALRQDWEQEKYLKKFTPNLKKKRISQHQELLEWMPLYLGKSKNVGMRVLEHIRLGLDKSTFALKLQARPEMANKSFRLHAIELRVTNYDLVVTTLEGALRNRFNPLIGKQ